MTTPELVEMARVSISTHGKLDSRAFAGLASLLRYVPGDYSDPETFARLKEALGAHFNLYMLGVIVLILAGGVVASLVAARSGPARPPLQDP